VYDAAIRRPFGVIAASGAAFDRGKLRFSAGITATRAGAPI
jgi:hypothetical protein